MSNPQKEEAIRLYAEERLSHREVAARVGRAPATVSGWLRRKAIEEGQWTNKDTMSMPPLPRDTRPLGARLMGDPLPGRSALDQRRQA